MRKAKSSQSINVIHLTVVKELTSGQKKQLLWEYNASQAVEGANWLTLAFQVADSDEQFVRQIPFLFRGRFMRKLYSWLVSIRLSKYCDFLLVRHVYYDPFGFILAPLVKNRLPVYHAKPIDEIDALFKGIIRKIATIAEFYSSYRSTECAAGVIGVTREIARTQSKICIEEKPAGVYPNGVTVDELEILKDRRSNRELHVGFICGTFAPWHGLDKVISAIDCSLNPQSTEVITIHLIGKLTDQQEKEIRRNSITRSVFRAYGILGEPEYRKILERCDFGLSSFALGRKNLTEASPLKVREMLAMGLPVYSGHADPALDEKQLFVKLDKKITLMGMIQFGFACKALSREEVRAHSRQRIGKVESMNALIKFLGTVKKKP